jgi:hypothetical protein
MRQSYDGKERLFCDFVENVSMADLGCTVTVPPLYGLNLLPNMLLCVNLMMERTAEVEWRDYFEFSFRSKPYCERPTIAVRLPTVRIC